MGEAGEPRRAQKRDQSHHTRLPRAEAQKLTDTKINQVKRVKKGWPRLEEEHEKHTIAWVMCPVHPRQAQRALGHICRHPKEAAGLCPGNGPHHLHPLLMPFPVGLWSHLGHQERSAVEQEAQRLRGKRMNQIVGVPPERNEKGSPSAPWLAALLARELVCM